MNQNNHRLYRSGDMVRIGCDDCRVCCDCCRGMGSSIILNPFDVFELCKGLGGTFETLLASKLELQVQDGIVLPNIRMTKPDMVCGFLDETGRCTVHAFRPGLCRLFPLGREYREGNLFYFVLDGACPHGASKIKIEKWIGIDELKRYEQFLTQWHNLVKKHMQDVQNVRERSEAGTDDVILQKNMAFLRLFYIMPYDREQSFYEQFEARAGIK